MAKTPRLITSYVCRISGTYLSSRAWWHGDIRVTVWTWVKGSRIAFGAHPKARDGAWPFWRAPLTVLAKGFRRIILVLWYATWFWRQRLVLILGSVSIFPKTLLLYRRKTNWTRSVEGRHDNIIFGAGVIPGACSTNYLCTRVRKEK